jgi:hypothetical protein
MNLKAKCLLVFFSMFTMAHRGFGGMSFNSANPDWIMVNGALTQLNLSSSNPVATLSAWVVNSSANTNVKTIIGLCNPANDNTVFVVDYALSGTAGKITEFFRNDAGSVLSDINSTVSTYNDGKPHFVCVVFNNGNVTLYVDGTVQGTSSAGVNNPFTFTTASIGACQRPSSANYQPFLGTIDDARIYGRALSAQEANNLFNSKERYLLTDGLPGYWPMDEGSYGVATSSGSVIVLDRSRNGNTGKIQGSPVWVQSNFLNYP